MTTTRGVKKVNENILSPGRAIIVTEKDVNQYKWSEIPVGSKFIDTKTGIEMVKLEGESTWVPAGIKNDGTLCIAKDTIQIAEIFTIVNSDEGDGHFLCLNENNELRHYDKTIDGYVFTLEKGSYQMNRNQIMVIIDDCLYRTASSGGLVEKSETKIILLESLVKGQEITIVYSNVIRIGNPYPRVFINKNEPDKSEIGDLWIDTDGELSDDDILGSNTDVNQTISWDRITGKPNTVSGYRITDPISYQGHTHSYTDITGSPTALPADGGNADTVQHLKPDNNNPGTLAVLDSLGKLPGEHLGDHTHHMADIVDLKIDVFQKGMIMMWYGSANAVPSGWAICNGLNGTPDLRDRFVAGAGTTYTMGQTGGEATHILTTKELPNTGDGLVGRWTSETGNNTKYNGDSGRYGATGYGFVTVTDIYDSNRRNGGGDHNVSDYEIDFRKYWGGQGHNNIPPFYALYYIMKIN